MRFILLGALATVLAGCVLPPAVAIGSYAADGLSYLVTGKSVSDHLLSEVVGEDCATWRMIKLENPCREYEDEDGDGMMAEEDAKTEIAAFEPVEEGAYDQAVPVIAVTEIPIEPPQAVASSVAVERIEPAAAATDRAATDSAATDRAATDRAANGIVAEPLAEARSPAPEAPQLADPGPAASPTMSAVAPRTKDVYLVMASFSRKSNALRLAEKHAAFAPVVVPARLGGRTFYRVATRLDSRRGVGDAQRHLAEAGFGDTWLLETCAGSPAAECLAWNAGSGGVEVAVLR